MIDFLLMHLSCKCKCRDWEDKHTCPLYIAFCSGLGHQHTQWRIKLSDDIWKCMEWTTISITLAFQYNFCFGIVLGDAGAVSQQKYVLREHTCPGGHIMKNQGYSVLTIYTGKPEIQVGKSNGPTYHFIYPGFQRIFFSYQHWWFTAKPRQRGAKCRGENNIFFSSAFFFFALTRLQYR